MTASQNDMILAALKQGRALTLKEAWDDFECGRLAARIHELKALGHDIIAEDVHDRRTGKRYARYKLANAAAQGEFRF